MSLKFGNFFIKFIFFAVGLFIFFPLSAQALVLAVSPSIIDLGFLRADNIFSQNLTLTLSSEEYHSDSELKVELDGVGKEAIQLDSDLIFFEAENIKKDFHFTINPKDLLPGKYEVQLLFYPISSTEFGDGSSLKIKLSTMIKFEVTTKAVLDIATSTITMVMYGSPGDQAKFDVVLKNLGNTKESIDLVKITITSDTDQIIRELVYTPSSTMIFHPKSTILFSTFFNIPTDLLVGDYRANFSYYSQGRVITESKDVKLNIKAPILAEKSFKLYYIAISFLSFVFFILLIKFFKK